MKILRALRAKLNLTQEQLADHLGVSFATVVHLSTRGFSDSSDLPSANPLQAFREMLMVPQMRKHPAFPQLAVIGR